jgi:hypothetical protein
MEESLLKQAHLKLKLAFKLRKFVELTSKPNPLMTKDGSSSSSSSSSGLHISLSQRQSQYRVLVSKCLIVASRYMFFDTCKLFLSQLYRLSLFEW